MKRTHSSEVSGEKFKTWEMRYFNSFIHQNIQSKAKQKKTSEKAKKENIKANQKAKIENENSKYKILIYV